MFPEVAGSLYYYKLSHFLLFSVLNFAKMADFAISVGIIGIHYMKH